MQIRGALLMEQVDEFALRLVQQGQPFVEMRLGLGRGLRPLLFSDGQLHRGGKQLLLDRVVQFAAQALPLLQRSQFPLCVEQVAQAVGHAIQALGQGGEFVAARVGDGGVEIPARPGFGDARDTAQPAHQGAGKQPPGHGARGQFRGGNQQAQQQEDDDEIEPPLPGVDGPVEEHQPAALVFWRCPRHGNQAERIARGDLGRVLGEARRVVRGKGGFPGLAHSLAWGVGREKGDDPAFCVDQRSARDVAGREIHRHFQEFPSPAAHGALLEEGLQPGRGALGRR